MTEYEILLLLDPDAPEARQNEVIERARGLVEQSGGSWDAHQPWGRRKLAYPIRKKHDGIYHLLHFTCEPETLDEISRVLRIDDAVMRHMATRRIKAGPGQPVAVGAPASEDAVTAPEPAEEEE